MLASFGTVSGTGTLSSLKYTSLSGGKSISWRSLKPSASDDSSIFSTNAGWMNPEDRSGTELVYAGGAGGSRYNHRGGAANYLCMPGDPLRIFCLLKSTLNTLSVCVLISSLLCIYRYASTDHQFGRFHSWTSHPQHRRGRYIWAERQLCVQVFWSHSST